MSDELKSCPECTNDYLAIRTDIYKDQREFVYCDCCGCMAPKSVWNLILRAALPVQAGEGEASAGREAGPKHTTETVETRMDTGFQGGPRPGVNMADAGGQGREDGLAAAAMKWWESKRPLGWGVKGHRAHPTVNCAEDEECTLAIACATLAKANDGEGA